MWILLIVLNFHVWVALSCGGIFHEWIEVLVLDSMGGGGSGFEHECV